MFKYLPVEKRTPDPQYKNLLKQILKEGVRTKSQQGVDALTLIGPQSLHYKLENGFPIITERKISEKIWKQAIGEILGFVNGARTQKELESYGCNWWKYWVTDKKCKKRGLEPGDMGPGSYGAAFHDFPTVEGPTYNQFKNIIEQIKEKPHLRTHFISPWVPQYTIRGKGKQQKVVVCPCHGWIHIRIINDKLTLHMFQRSSDTPIGLPANLAQYAALTMMIAKVTGYEAYEYVHSFSDAHIYVDQIPAVEELIAREDKVLPTMTMKEKDDFFAYRVEDFTLSEYDPHPGIWNIPVAI
ncbi:MAG: thymidylate synthase [Candidatus Pacebacteria bacterium]|jgi:thymidylate synthase|nr:thymidylate synthase [Candidatus Paceibacterota bacterium]MBT4652749.1 thymidylate synthase [Candidatus Paceibacterota bacterium]MBT6755906.1 thymidylate synthase [Candidatus Paceibacterota bacterium]MBT6921119.1 thymidylate synthase [Candidatus Paceibacterota bacterium]